MPRPYRMPVGTVGAHLIMLPPVAFIFIVLATATLRTWLVSGGLAGVGILSYWLMEFLKARRLVDFYVTPPTPVALSDLSSPPDAAAAAGGEQKVGADGEKGEGEEEEDDDDDVEGELWGGECDEESLCPQPPHQQHPQHPRRPAAVTLVERVARSMSPLSLSGGRGGGGGDDL